MSNSLHNFDKQLKETYENYEAPFNEEHWNEMAHSLNSAPQSYSTAASLIGTALVIGILIGGYFFYNPFEKTPKSSPAADTTQIDSAGKAAGNHTEAKTEKSASNPAAKVTSKNAPSAEKTPAENTTSQPAKKQTAQPSNHSGKPAGNSAAKKDVNKTKKLTAGDFSKFSVTAHDACAGNFVDFTLDHPRENARYLWNFGDGFFSNEANPTHQFTKSGVFDVSLSVTSSKGGNISSNIVQNMIKIVEVPTARFGFKRVGKGAKVRFSSQSLKTNNVMWMFGDGASSTENSPLHIYSSPGNYEVKLVAINANDCSDTLRKMVRIKEKYNLNAPKGFSPQNGESFMPEDLKNMDAPFTLRIYNPENGIVIYKTSGNDHPWNGTFEDEVVENGSYPWIVNIAHPRGSSQQFSGKVSVR